MRDEEAIHRYLSSLHMEHIAGNYSFSGNEKRVTMIYDTPGGVLSVDWKLLDVCMTAE